MNLKALCIEILEQNDGSQKLVLSGKQANGKVVVLGERRLLTIEGNVKEWLEVAEPKADWSPGLAGRPGLIARVAEAAQASAGLVEERSARFVTEGDYYQPGGSLYALRNAQELEGEYMEYLRAMPGQLVERSGRPMPRTSRLPTTGRIIPPTADAVDPRQETFRRELQAQRGGERCESLMTAIRQHFPRLDVSFRLEGPNGYFTTALQPLRQIEYAFYVRLDRVDPEDGWGTELYSLSAAYHQRGVNLETLHGRV